MPQIGARGQVTSPGAAARTHKTASGPLSARTSAAGPPARPATGRIQESSG
jgi:hypothetical protein